MHNLITSEPSRDTGLGRSDVVDTLPGSEALLTAFELYQGSWKDAGAGQTYPAAELRRGADHTVRWLRGWGICPGSRVVLSAANSPVLLCTLMALLELGAAPVLLHTDTPPRELLRVARRAQTDRVIVHKCVPEMLSEVGATCQSAEILPWLRFTAARFDTPEQTERQPEGVLLHATSGTTGRPKLAARTAAAAVADGRNYLATLDLDRGDVILAASPMTHVYAFGMAVVTPLLQHMSVVVMDRFHPRAVSAAIDELGVSVLPAVPGMLEPLLASYQPTTSMPRMTFTAGAPLPFTLARKYFQHTGRWPQPLYGTTETGLISVARTQQEAAHPNTVGLPAVGVEVDLAAVLGSSALETTLVRSEALMAGYLDEGRIDTSAVQRGWYRTGDLATRQPDGSYSLNGRDTDIINVGGLNVVPLEVEEVVAAIPGVTGVKVYGKQGNEGSESVNVAVVGSSTVTKAMIAAQCREHLIYYKRPTVIHLVDSLPTTASGKVLVAELP